MFANGMVTATTLHQIVDSTVRRALARFTQVAKVKAPTATMSRSNITGDRC